jgi:RimJ/RimL family protein N-acetyltransferase
LCDSHRKKQWRVRSTRTPLARHDAFVTELITRRLELRRWSEQDLDAYAALVADAEVMRYLRGGPIDRAAAWRELALFIGHRELRGFSQAAVIERSTGRLIGRGGLWRPEGWPGLEVGWVLERASWGNGYASELGRAVRDHAFAVLEASHLISVIHRDNERSIRVAEAIGATLERPIESHGMPCLIYGQPRK